MDNSTNLWILVGFWGVALSIGFGVACFRLRSRGYSRVKKQMDQEISDDQDISSEDHYMV